MNPPQTPFKIEHYVIGRTLGVGAFGKVKMAKHEITNVNVAIKIINKKKMKTNKMGAKIKREIKLLRYFNHPNIIKLYEVLDTSSDIFVVMEFAEKGELFDQIAQRGKLIEAEARNYFLQIVAGIEHCHNNLVAHRDLKPENILLTDKNVIKIADFGLSNLMKDGKYLKTSCGSPNYAAPEVVSGKLYCGADADIWSCGVILYALLAGQLPFDEEVLPALFKKIKEADYVIPSHMSPQAKDLITKMLVPDPTYRTKFNDIHLHPWIRGNSIPFYLMMPFKQDEGRRVINLKVFEKLQSLVPQISFDGLTDAQVKRSILKREDRPFVVIYELLVSELIVETTSTMRVTTLTKQDLIFDPQLAFIGNYSFDNGLLQKETKYQPYQFSYNISTENILAVTFPFPAKFIVKNLYNVLEQFHTIVKLKSPDYKFKCFYKNTIKMTKYNSSMDLFIDLNTNDEFGSSTNFASLNLKDGEKAKNKEFKYSSKEIVFYIQIFRLPNNVDHVVDFQLRKGHPMVFMDFCNKIIALLNQNLYQVQTMN